jgi:hypothetical protein
MDGDLSRIAGDQHGVFFRHQALDCGYRDPEIATLVRNGTWVRLRRGAYATREAVEVAGATGQHVLIVRAVTQQLSGLVVVTGASALAVLGVPVWGVPLDRAHVHREAGKSSRSEAGVSHHVGVLPDDQVMEVAGLFVAAPAWALVAAARTASFEAGVVMADGVRRVHQVDVAELKDAAERQRDWAGSVKANRVIDFSDPRAATVGESRGRVLIARLGLPAPDLQRRIDDADGRLLGISDFYFDEYQTAGVRRSPEVRASPLRTVRAPGRGRPRRRSLAGEAAGGRVPRPRPRGGPVRLVRARRSRLCRAGPVPASLRARRPTTTGPVTARRGPPVGEPCTVT